MEGTHHFTKWTANIVGALIIFIFITYGMDEGFPIFFHLPWIQAVPWIAISISFGGFILGWFYPLYGGILGILGWCFFGFSGWKFEYRSWMTPYIWTLLVTGILYVVAHFTGQKAEAESKREEALPPSPVYSESYADSSASVAQSERESPPKEEDKAEHPFGKWDDPQHSSIVPPQTAVKPVTTPSQPVQKEPVTRPIVVDNISSARRFEPPVRPETKREKPTEKGDDTPKWK